jgi:hypothetical protein
MTKALDRIAEIYPKLRRRACGGWLAICPHSVGLSFGVTAPTREEAENLFRFELSRWLDILSQKTLDVPK